MAQKLATLYHLLLLREQLLTSDLHTPTTLITLHRSTPVREAQADIVEAGVGRRADLGQMTLSSQISPTPGWTLPLVPKRKMQQRCQKFLNLKNQLGVNLHLIL